VALSIRLKLLSVIDKLVKMASDLELVEKLLEEFPEARARSALLTIYDERGRLSIHLALEGGRPAAREVDAKNPPFATTEISMHVDTFIALFERRLDFWTAYLHDLVEVKSNDGLPASYHVLLWGAFFDKLFSQVLPKRR